MHPLARRILRFGIGILLVWFGVLILMHPSDMANAVQPWARLRIAGTMRHTLTLVAFLDFALAALLFLDLWVWIVSLVTAGCLVIAMIVLTSHAGTLSHVALAIVSLALAIGAAPVPVLRRLRIRK